MELPSVQVMEIDEQKELIRCESVIEEGLANFIEVGKALMVIKEKCLYRNEYGNFGAYCRQRWGMSRYYAHRIVSAAEIALEMLPIGNISPVSENQVRPLTALKDPEERQQVWERAVEVAGGKVPTQAQVQEVVNTTRGAPLKPNPAASIAIGPDIEKSARRIVDFYTLPELRKLVALITTKGGL